MDCFVEQQFFNLCPGSSAVLSSAYPSWLFSMLEHLNSLITFSTASTPFPPAKFGTFRTFFLCPACVIKAWSREWGLSLGFCFVVYFTYFIYLFLIAWFNLDRSKINLYICLMGKKICFFFLLGISSKLVPLSTWIYDYLGAGVVLPAGSSICAGLSIWRL